MLTLGLLSIRYDHETEYFTNIAKYAVEYQMKVVRLRPSDLRPNTNAIEGLIFDSATKQWQKGTFPLPNYLYDRCFYHSDQAKKQKPIIDWLKQRKDITFLGHGLPNKLDILDALFEHDVLRPHIPTTHKALHPKHVLQVLHEKEKIVLKPIFGSGGIDIYFLTKKDQKIQVETQKGKQLTSKIFSFKDCSRFLQQLLEKQSYMIQSYLSLTDENYAPFDLRIFLQKNQDGLWEQKGLGIRKGRPFHLISNLSGGSTVETYYSWKKNAKDGKKIERLIQKIVKHIPPSLEQQLVPLFELGLDIGIDQDHHIWILDVNSKPGRKVVLQMDPDIAEELYRAPLAYCQFLARNGVTTIG